MRARKSIDVGGFLDRDQTVTSGGRIHQDTKGVIGEGGQSHSSSRKFGSLIQIKPFRLKIYNSHFFYNDTLR
jgi:hypothetical protein